MTQQVLTPESVRQFETGCQGLAKGRAAEPCVMVIFGVTGDLTRRELMPSLYQLQNKGLLPDSIAIIGFARRDWTDDYLREKMREAVSQEENFENSSWRRLAERLFYVRGNFDDPAEESYSALGRKINELQQTFKIPDQAVFHLATPPEFYEDIVQRMEQAGLARSKEGWRRVIVEKPFGRDRQTAERLNRNLTSVVTEDQIYRIDHYLGKETVQNKLVFRFANPSFEPIWNRNYIDSVEISAGEEIGIGTRGNFYESIGVVRDMIQNHLLQLLCMIGMEPPVAFDSWSLRSEMVEVLRAVCCISLERDCVRGQYGPGTVHGKNVPGYRQEQGVPPDSTTPTFAAIRAQIDNWRWAGVPFYLRSGKRMARKLTDVTIQFKPTPHLMFPLEGDVPQHSNVLTFRVQPEEGIIQRFVAKQPGPEICMQPVKMTFLYADAFGIQEPPSAYEWLLLDVMKGEQTLFARDDWIETAWSIVDPIIDYWDSNPPRDFPNYPAGTWGPSEADHLVAREGRQWVLL